MKQDMNWNKLLWRCVDNNAYQGCRLPDRDEFVEEPFDQEGSSNAPQYPPEAEWNNSGEVNNGGTKEKNEWSDGWNNNGGTKETTEWSDGWNDNAGAKEKEEWSDGWNDNGGTAEKDKCTDGWNNNGGTAEKEECSDGLKKGGGEEIKNAGEFETSGDFVAKEEDEWSDGWK